MDINFTEVDLVGVRTIIRAEEEGSIMHLISFIDIDRQIKVAKVNGQFIYQPLPYRDTEEADLLLDYFKRKNINYTTGGVLATKYDDLSIGSNAGNLITLSVPNGSAETTAITPLLSSMTQGPLLAREMLKYATQSCVKTNDINYSEIRKALGFFFTEEELVAAEKYHNFI